MASPSPSPLVLTPTSSQETLEDQPIGRTAPLPTSRDGEPDSTQADNEQAREEKSKKIENKLAKSEVHFAFGPQTWYFLRCGTSWRSVRPKSSASNDFDSLSPEWLAFKHNTGQIFGGPDKEGWTRIMHTWNDSITIMASEAEDFVNSRKAYEKLYKWLIKTMKEKTEEAGIGKEYKPDISVTIGPEGSYFARCDSDWIRHGLPNDLNAALDKSTKSGEYEPVQIALGIHGAWIVLWTDGTRSWDLRYSYPGLQGTALLDDERDGWVVFAALHPHESNRYFVVTDAGSCSYKVVLADNNELRIVNEMTDDYLKMRAKKDGSNFTRQYTQEGKTVRATISQEGKRLENQRDRLMQSWKDRRGQLTTGNLAIIGAISGGAGLLSKLGGASSMKAVTVAGSAGIGAAVGILIHS